MSSEIFRLGSQYDYEEKYAANEPWSSITKDKDGVLKYAGVGCGCCGSWGDVSKEGLEVQIGIYETALSDLKALRLKMDEVTK